MQQVETKFTYELLTSDQTNLIAQAAECLAKTFIGVQVGDKWIQEPIIGYALQLPYDDFYEFTKSYIEDFVHQGYCAVALDENRNVVGALVGDTNAFEIVEEELFSGTFSNMNKVMDVLHDIDARFLNDFKLRNGRPLQDGDGLHLFLLGVISENNRHAIVQNLGDILIEKAKKDGLQFVLAEATNPKSIRLLDKFHGLTKYVDVDGNYIVHSYKDNEHLNVIPTDVADGIYIILKQL
ncbi:MAG: hypothetical protein ABS882_10005 [Lysinibacillus sp.]